MNCFLLLAKIIVCNRTSIHGYEVKARSTNSCLNKYTRSCFPFRGESIFFPIRRDE